MKKTLFQRMPVLATTQFRPASPGQVFINGQRSKS